MADALTVTLPLPPNRGNSRVQWRARHAQTRRYLGDALGQLQALRVGRACPWSPVEVSAVLYVHNRMDDDNAVARLKVPLDALTRAGIIRDDRRPHCRLAGIPEQVIDRRRPRVELTVRQVAA